MLDTFHSHQAGSFEVLYYKKNGHGIWLQVEITPIKNEQNIVVLFLCTFRDITAFKEPLGATTMMSNLSKFAKLAWTMTLSRNAAGNSTSTSQNAVVPRERLNNNFTDSLPEYRHEPPKTPQHILLHYSTFKVIWDWVILGLTFYTVVMVPFNLAFNRIASNDDITLLGTAFPES